MQICSVDIEKGFEMSEVFFKEASMVRELAEKWFIICNVGLLFTPCVGMILCMTNQDSVTRRICTALSIV